MKEHNTIILAKNIRISAVKMTNRGGSSHIGPILSIADILAVLYGSILNLRPDAPEWKGRDRFILSKGHAGAGVYAALAELNFFSKSKLSNYYKNGSIYSGHLSHKGIPGVEFSTGSLGHGLSVCCGLSYAAKINKENHRVFCLVGDGELGEGSNWEAIMFASHHNLDNLTVIVDRNRLQSIKNTEDTLALDPLDKKFSSFGWNVIDVNGHNHTELGLAINNIKKGLPSVIIANTIKGKGVSFMENSIEWHYRTPLGEFYYQALKELDKS